MDKDSFVQSFPGRLKELRVQAGLTQKELAEKAGVSKTTVAALEQGLYEPVLSTAMALAAALGVDCTAFTQPPAEREPSGPGRPKKPEAEPVVEPAPRKPRGRPRKGISTAEGTAPATAEPVASAGEGRTEAPEGEPPAKGKRQRKKG